MKKISKAVSKIKENKFRKERFESSYKDVIIIKKKDSIKKQK